MAWTDEQLRRIYDRTQGKCHICGKKLALKNYGVHGSRGCWSVEHSHARALGGSDHGNNLYPACISCNSSKGSGTTRSARAQHGRTRAPLSRKAERKVRVKNAVAGAGIGAVIGGVLGGPPGAVVGGLFGGAVGHEADPE
ncbi:MAG TPA: HNH endonuclease [Planctomycetota bacterium]|nr:HNH endonuclease [Planctomycetota bacterium]HRR82785.1 HNH endonuclease [Planctomycetota bacterium]HRT93830.1 HNH endonuclease [Planctomycetota bacterium]